MLRNLAINEITTQLETSEGDINNKLYINSFKEYYLPYFTGESAIGEHDSIRHGWVVIAGGPFKSVDLVDESGEYIITVPPLLNKEIINVNLEPSIVNASTFSLSHKIASEHSAMGGANYLNNNIDILMEKYISPSSETRSDWNELFSYFGVNLSRYDSGTVDSLVNSSDDLIYD